jgi:hypothetical protein
MVGSCSLPVVTSLQVLVRTVESESSRYEEAGGGDKLVFVVMKVLLRLVFDLLLLGFPGALEGNDLLDEMVICVEWLRFKED